MKPEKTNQQEMEKKISEQEETLTQEEQQVVEGGVLPIGEKHEDLETETGSGTGCNCIC